MLRLSGICKRFEDLPVLSNLSLTLSRGEIVALIGPSGCGKTTLLNIISGLTAPDAGTVEGADGRLSYMFQSARLLPWRTVEENIRLVREEAPAGEVRSLITAVGLEGFERYYPGQLSGGMARRLALARCAALGSHFRGWTTESAWRCCPCCYPSGSGSGPGCFLSHMKSTKRSLWRPASPCSLRAPLQSASGLTSPARRGGTPPPLNWPGCAKRSSGGSPVRTGLVATAMASHKEM